MSYSFKPPPPANDVRELSSWLERELQAVERAFQETTELDLRIRYREPEHPRPGMIVYADGTEWDPGEGEGLYVYTSGNVWVSLRVLELTALFEGLFTFTGEKIFEGAPGSDAAEFRNSVEYGLVNGGAPKYRYAVKENTLRFDQYGNVQIGPNYLTSGPIPGTYRTEVADFWYAANSMRLLLRDITLSQIGDPTDINGRRAGPEGGFPYGGGVGTATANGTTTVTIASGNGIFRTGQRIHTTDHTVKVSDNVTIVGGTAVDITSPVGTLILSAAVPTGVYSLFSIGRSQDLCGYSNGANIFQLRMTPPIIPYLGDNTTAGAKFQESAIIQFFKTTEGSRDLTGNNDYALGSAWSLQLVEDKRADSVEAFQVRGRGRVKIGRGAILASDPGPNGPRVHIQGDVGTNEKQTLTSTATGGTFTLDFFPSVPTNGYPTAETTVAIAWNASAATVQAALEGLLSIAPLDVTVTGGPLNTTPIVIEFTGTLANTNFTRMRVTSSLTGGSLSVSETQKGVEATGATVGSRLLLAQHGGAVGSTPVGDYFEWRDPSANPVFELQGSGNLRHNGDFELEGAFNHDGTTFGAFGTAPATKPTVSGSRGGNAALASALTALAALGLITDSTSA